MSEYSFKDGVLKTPIGIAAVSSEIIFPQLMEDMISELEAAISREEMLGDQLDIADEHVKELKAQLSEAHREIEQWRKTITHFVAVSNDPDLHADDDERYQEAFDSVADIVGGKPPRVDGSGYVLKEDYWDLVKSESELKEQFRWRNYPEEKPEKNCGFIPVKIQRYDNEYNDIMSWIGDGADDERWSEMGIIKWFSIPELVESPPTGEDVDNE